MEDVILGFARRHEMEIAVAAAVVTWTLLFFVFTSWTKSRKDLKLRLPPGPKGWPLIGALPYVGEFPHKSFYNLSKKYGPLMYMRLGAMPALVVSNAEMAKEVLQTNDQNFASRPELLAPTILYYGNQDMAFAPYGAHWRQARKVVNLQVLTPTKLGLFMDIIKNEILSTVHTILERSESDGKHGASIDMTAVTAGTTMNIITQMMWKKRHRNVKGGETRRDARFDELIKTAMSLLGSNNVADFLPTALKSSVMKLSGIDKKVKEVRDGLGEFVDSIVREKEQALAKEADLGAPSGEDDDLLSVMLKLKNESGVSPGLPREAMQSILIDMILGGTDTSSVTLDWTFTTLMKRPDILKKLQDELSAVVGEDRLVNESDIQNLKYLDAVVKEALRVFSAGPVGIPHMSTADCKIAGYNIPANTVVFVNIFAIHRDETVWENPLEFNPDRFLQKDLDYRGRDYEYIPFSSGRRICPGLNLASTFLHLALAQLLHTITWSLPEGQSPETLDTSESSGLVVCRATPLLLAAKPRLARHVIYATESL